jgi:hypothetical protein
MYKPNNNVWQITVLALAMLGCADIDGSGPSRFSSEELLTNEPGLEILSEDDSVAGLPSCEGLLHGNEYFAIASAERGLIAALTPNGSLLCVDDLGNVEEELTETGHEDEADSLVVAFAATLRSLETARTPNVRLGARHEGDPDPQPNSGWGGFSRRGDPDPQPNSGF